MNKLKLGLAAFGILLGLTVAKSAWAGSVTQAKGDQVLIQLDSSDPIPQVGDRFFVLVDGKKKAAIEVVKVKGQRGIAKVLKGTPAVGGQLSPITSRPAPRVAQPMDNPDETADVSPRARRHRKKVSKFPDESWGVSAGINQVSQSLTVGSASQGFTPISMTGMGYSLRVFYDTPINDSLGIILLGGAKQFNLTASVNGESANTSILYASTGALFRYRWVFTNFAPFVEAGGNFDYPLTQSSNVLSGIGSSISFIGGGGVNYLLNSTSYLQAAVEYGYYMPSNGVSTTMIALTGGMGWRW